MSATHRFSTIAAAAWKRRALALKAMSFALIGAVNAMIDAVIFFTGYILLGTTAGGIAFLQWIVGACGCGGFPTVRLVVANVISWSVAVTCSYVMNSFITFAAESGRKLRWRSYATFVASGTLGVLANTTVLVSAAQVMPIWAAKGLALLASFVVNFSMSHLVIFRVRPTRMP